MSMLLNSVANVLRSPEKFCIHPQRQSFSGNAKLLEEIANVLFFMSISYFFLHHVPFLGAP